METARSSLEFRSNLQPVRDGNWGPVYSKIMDPFALKILQDRQIFLTQQQKDQYRYASEHCAYAFRGDYPWGTVLMPDGSEQPVCKCLNTRCPEFKKCRPDFEPVELDILAENRDTDARVIRFSPFRNEEIIEKHEQETKDEEAVALEPEETPSGLPAAGFPFETTDDISEPVAAVSAPEPETMIMPEPVPEPELCSESELETETVPEPEADHLAEPEEELLPAVAEDAPAGFHKFKAVSQQTVISAPCDARAIVNAGPGTGKTWTLIERIIDLVYRQETDPENIMILCFSRAAVEVIEQRLKEAAAAGRIGYEFNNLMIRTFDSFATYAISWVMENYPELLTDHYSFEGQSYEDRIRTFNTIIGKKKDLVELYEHLIVDEVQDLVGNRARMVLGLLNILPESCGFTLLGDACQAIYDWQTNNDPSIISSERFYQELFQRWPNIHYWSFETNHRQTERLTEFTEPYRNAILTGSADDRKNALTHILAKVYESRIKIMKPNPADIEQYTNLGTLGILTRTNAQALKVSELLNNADIEHIVAKSADQQDLAPWIAKLFCNYPNETISENLFAPCYLQVFPDAPREQIRAAWKALISTQYGDPRPHYDVEKLLDGILRRGKARELFETDFSRSGITVSTIHRAKGKEFDSVLVLSDVLTTDEKDADDLQEHKVRYVAITRPKDRIHQLSIGKQYIYIDKNTRRCFQAGFSKYKKGASYLAHIEVGLSGDINTKSFAETEKTQSFIRNDLKPGTRAKLIKDRIESGWVRYRIVLEENENIILGYTGRDFSLGIRRALQRIWDNDNPSVKYYPNIWGDVYINNLTTCISSSGAGLEGAKTYGNLAVWEGFSLRGLARYEKDNY